MVQLCLVYITLIAYSPIVITVLLVGIVINVILSLKMAHTLMGLSDLVAGCYKGSEETWAGQANRDWWKGCVIKREISNGMYEPEFVSLKRLKEMYG
jgi:hypothetical protein